MSLPWFKQMVAEIANVDLPNEELGARLRLESHFWERGSLPSDPRRLATIACTSARRLANIWPNLRPFFPDNPDDSSTLISSRLVELRQIAMVAQAVQLEKSSKGGKTLAAIRASGAASGTATALPAGVPPSRETLRDVDPEDPDPDPEEDLAEVAPAEVAPATPPPPENLTLLPTAPAGLTREAAIGRIASASGGRFVASKATKGGTFSLDRMRKAHPSGEIFSRVGAWLAAGGDGWRGTLDGRALGDLEAWAARALAWDGKSAVDPRSVSPPKGREKSAAEAVSPAHPESMAKARSLF